MVAARVVQLDLEGSQLLLEDRRSVSLWTGQCELPGLYNLSGGGHQPMATFGELQDGFERLAACPRNRFRAPWQVWHFEKPMGGNQHLSRAYAMLTIRRQHVTQFGRDSSNVHHYSLKAAGGSPRLASSDARRTTTPPAEVAQLAS